MKTTAILETAVVAAVCMSSWVKATARDITRCDLVFEEVRSAVEKEPHKILVIVEDAMVANETCACEIVKGAITGSSANADLKRQVVLAATHIAPNMAQLIASCAGTMAPVDGGKGVVETLKEDMGLPTDGAQPTGFTSSTGDDDYNLMPDDIRGVYLIQPSSSGISTRSVPKETPAKTTTRVVNHRRPRHSIALSPSVALGP